MHTATLSNNVHLQDLSVLSLHKCWISVIIFSRTTTSACVYIFIRGAFSCCSTPELIFTQTMNRGAIDAAGSIRHRGRTEGWMTGRLHPSAETEGERCCRGIFPRRQNINLSWATQSQAEKQHLQTRCFVLGSFYRPQTSQTARKRFRFVCCCHCKQVPGGAQSVNSLQHQSSAKLLFGGFSR